MKYRVKKVTDEEGIRFYPECRASGWWGWIDTRWYPIDEFVGNLHYSTLALAQSAIQEQLDIQRLEIVEKKEEIIPMEVLPNGQVRQEFKGRG